MVEAFVSCRNEGWRVAQRTELHSGGVRIRGWFEWEGPVEDPTRSVWIEPERGGGCEFGNRLLLFGAAQDWTDG